MYRFSEETCKDFIRYIIENQPETITDDMALNMATHYMRQLETNTLIREVSRIMLLLEAQRQGIDWDWCP